MLEGSAAEIWRCLQEADDVGVIVAQVAERYDVEAQVVRADVLAWLEEAEALGLVSRA